MIYLIVRFHEIMDFFGIGLLAILQSGILNPCLGFCRIQGSNSNEILARNLLNQEYFDLILEELQ